MSRIRMGENQEIETLVNEEAMLSAMFLGNEKESLTLLSLARVFFWIAALQTM